MATPLEILKQADGMRLVDQDGNEDTLNLLPPLSAEEIAELEVDLGPLPAEVRELVNVTRGFDGILDQVDFFALREGLGMEDAFPHAHPIAHDGYGNFWVVDVRSTPPAWDGIFFVCHDPPVIIWQTDSLAHFLSEVIRFGNPPWQSEIDEVHERDAMRIWSENPGLITQAEALQASDLGLAEFASTLDGSYELSDLRQAQCGDGFSWGRYGPRTVVKRHGEERLFAIQKPERRTSLWNRLLGR